MQIDDNELEDRASSADLELDEQNDQLSADAADGAKSSAATGENDDSDLLQVVRDVVDASKPADQAASPAEGEDNSDQEDGKKEQDDEDYSDVPFHKHPRFQQLLRKSKAHEQDAIRYRNVESFIEEQGLEAEEAADLLVIGGLMKSNPVEAWKRAKPTIQKLLVAAGEVLPDDLRERVAKRELTNDAALEISRSRAAHSSVERSRSFEQQRSERKTQRDAASASQTAAHDWEQDRRAKDPNFEAKLPTLMEKVAYLQRTEGVPNTPDGVRAQLQKAYKGIVLPAASQPSAPSASAPAARPQKKPITPVRGGAVAGNQRPTNVSTLDIIRQHAGA